MKSKKYIWIILLVVVLIIIDQIIKMYICNNLYNSSIIGIKSLVNITYIENTGGAYGIGNGSTILFIITNVIIIGIIVKFLVAKMDNIKQFTVIALLFVVAGGMGNLIDRIFRGFVVDYIDISPIINFPIFNFADMCITIGIAVLIISNFKDNFIKQETKVDEKV